jgi:hypothetical protein
LPFSVQEAQSGFDRQAQRTGLEGDSI